MNNDRLYNDLASKLSGQLKFLDDKPEETVESTLKALWFAAAGKPVSAEKALMLNLPGLNPKQVRHLNVLIESRLKNNPLAHITKRQSFMGIELIADNRALIPRKETEILGKKAVELARSIINAQEKARVIDVCCGSGNLGIAVAVNVPGCIVFSADLSKEATELAQENVNLTELENRVTVRQGDLFSAFETDEFYEKTDLIICNPPYILSSKVAGMDSEIASNEPVLAFDGGMLGISIIQKLIRETPKFLSHQGWLVFEVGAGQGNFIIQLIERSKLYHPIESIEDDAGIIRVIAVQKVRGNA